MELGTHLSEIVNLYSEGLRRGLANFVFDPTPRVHSRIKFSKVPTLGDELTRRLRPPSLPLVNRRKRGVHLLRHELDPFKVS